MLRLLSSPKDVAEALVASTAWSTQLDLCTPAVDSHLGKWPLWRELLGDERRVRHAYVAVDAMRSEPHALEHLHRLGVLRLVPAADGSFRAHVLRFRQANTVRIFAGTGALVPDGVMAPLEATTLWEGDALAPYAVETDRLFARAKQLAHVPEPAELRKYAALYFQAAPFRDALSEVGAPLIRRTAFDGEVCDLELVEGAMDVRRAAKSVREHLAEAATASMRETIGFHGGNFEATLAWSSALGMWSLCRKAEVDYGHYFGVERPGTVKSLQITVQVNVPHAGVDRKRGGAIAREPGTGKLFLVHRGKLGGGQKGVGAELFWSRFRGGVPMREPGREEGSRVVIVGEIGAPSFARDVAAFVHEVARIKRGVG